MNERPGSEPGWQNAATGRLGAPGRLLSSERRDAIAGAERRSTILAPGLTFLALALTAIGLLSLPVGEYDDSILLVGARLTNAGRVPYLDFYSHYGALGFRAIGALMNVVGDPGLTLRIGQIALLAVLAIFLNLFFRSLAPGTRSEYLVPVTVLWLGQTAILTAFFGFALAISSLLLYLLAAAAPRRGRRLWLGAASGLLAAGCTLTRPAFGVYLVAGIVLAEVAMRVPAERAAASEKWDVFGLFAATGFCGAAVVWWLLFAKVSPALAFEATFVTPARLVATADSRYLPPVFLAGVGSRDHGLLFAVMTGAAMAATFIPWWTSGIRIGPGTQRPRLSIITSIAAGGLLPLLLIGSSRSARDANLLAVLLVCIAAGAVWFNRRGIAQSNVVRAAATFGLCGATFGHYYWARADGVHLIFPLTVGLVGAVLLLGSATRISRIALLLPFVVVYLAAVFPFPLPAIDGLTKPAFGTLLPWRCAIVPADTRSAVDFADRHADAQSRFVAVGSSQAWSSADPVQLFLLSARLPYTRWFQYDPGIQTSAPVQRQMMSELWTSGSRTAVVWSADRYLFDLERPRIGARSQFDVCFDVLYPIPAAKIGRYEVRLRSAATESPAAKFPPECAGDGGHADAARVPTR